MTQTGMVREIAGTDLLVEPFRGEPGEGSSCGCSGGCESCGQRGKIRLVKVANPGNLTVKKGSLVRFEVSAALALLAAIRILIAPPALFAALYFSLRGRAGIIAGAAGAAALFLLNILFRKKASEMEQPVLLEVL